MTIGVGALTRGEALLLVPLLLVPIVRKPHGGRAALATCLACVAVLMPWTIRNVIAFHRPVIVSTDLATAIAGANCPATYNGGSVGDWHLTCVRHYLGDDAQSADRAMSDGIHYALHHLARLPVVLGARVLRVWGVRTGFPFGARLPHLEGREAHALAAGYLMYLILLALGLQGLLLLRRRREEAWILMTPFLLVSLIALVFYGTPRLRQPAEVAIVVLSALALEHNLSKWRSRQSSRKPRVATGRAVA